MNYSEGVQYMLKFASSKGSFEPYNGIIINYPGYKGKGDYRLTFNNGKAPKHDEICSFLYNLIANNVFKFEELQDFLNNIYINGTKKIYNNNTLEDLKHLIYWITLQEEINYPRSRGFAGINLAFCRFFEAIYATQPTNGVTLQDVQARCNNHGRNRPDLYVIHNAPSFYTY